MPLINTAALRKNNGGIISRPFISQDSSSARNARQDSAGFAALDEQGVTQT